MKIFTYVINDTLGIHARPAGLLVKEASKFNCSITLEKSEKSANAKGLFAIMGLAVKCGEEVTVRCDGEDEDAAYDAMLAFFSDNL